MPRRRLRDIELVGPERRVRHVMLAIFTWLSASSFVLYLLERHHVDTARGFMHDGGGPPVWADAHALFSETYGVPLIGPLLIFLACLWARRGFPRALLPGLLALPNAVAIIGCWISAHLFDTTEGTTLLTGAATLTTFVMPVLGIALVVVEIVCPIVARRRLEATDPVFPTARVVD